MDLRDVRGDGHGGSTRRLEARDASTRPTRRAACSARAATEEGTEGLTLLLRVNGQAVYARGANVVPRLDPRPHMYFF